MTYTVKEIRVEKAKTYPSGDYGDWVPLHTESIDQHTNRFSTQEDALNFVMQHIGISLPTSRWNLFNQLEDGAEFSVDGMVDARMKPPTPEELTKWMDRKIDLHVVSVMVVLKEKMA